MGSKEPKTLLHVKIGQGTRDFMHLVYIVVGVFILGGIAWLINYLLG